MKFDKTLATPVLLSGSECWPNLCFCLDPNVGQIFASVWIRMLARPMLSGSMFATPMPLNSNVGHACVSAWTRMLVMPVSLPGSECWSCLCLCLDPNVGRACVSAWTRMLVVPVPLPGSECWSCLCLCLDPSAEC